MGSQDWFRGLRFDSIFIMEGNRYPLFLKLYCFSRHCVQSATTVERLVPSFALFLTLKKMVMSNYKKTIWIKQRSCSNCESFPPSLLQLNCVVQKPLISIFSAFSSLTLRILFKYWYNRGIGATTSFGMRISLNPLSWLDLTLESSINPKKLKIGKMDISGFRTTRFN